MDLTWVYLVPRLSFPCLFVTELVNWTFFTNDACGVQRSSCSFDVELSQKHDYSHLCGSERERKRESRVILPQGDFSFSFLICFYISLLKNGWKLKIVLRRKKKTQVIRFTSWLKGRRGRKRSWIRISPTNKLTTDICQ